MSARNLRIVLLALTVLGIGVAAYLTYVHYSGDNPVCSTKHNTCAQVQKSRYSQIAGVNVALIGLIGYVMILASLLAPEGETSRLATVALTVVGFGFSAYLTYRELFTLHKICEWCVSSAVILTVLMCLAVWRFLRGEDFVRGSPPQGGRASADASGQPAPLEPSRP